MILSDATIKKKLKTGEIKIEPFNEEQLQPASYDVRLGNDFMFFDNTSQVVIDPKKDCSHSMKKVRKEDGDPFVLHPGQFVLGVNKEYIGTDNKHLHMLNGKSSLGRLGLLIHATAGFIDPGNELCATLELFNVATMPILLYPGMKIAQVVFEELSEPSEKSYGDPRLKSKYYKNRSVVGSLMHKNFKENDENKDKKS